MTDWIKVGTNDFFVLTLQVHYFWFTSYMERPLQTKFWYIQHNLLSAVIFYPGTCKWAKKCKKLVKFTETNRVVGVCPFSIKLGGLFRPVVFYPYSVQNRVIHVFLAWNYIKSTNAYRRVINILDVHSGVFHPKIPSSVTVCKEYFRKYTHKA